MTLKSLKTIGSLAATVAMALMVLTLAACMGADGHDGRDGSDGNPGNPGSPGTDGRPGDVINARALTEEQWAALRLKGEITGVTMGATPVVNFRLTDGFDTPISGMSWTSKAAASAYATYPNLAFGIAKLVPEQYASDNGRMVAPSRWVNYIVTSNPTAAAPDAWNPTRPTTDNIGTLKDNGDGTYEYTFRRDITQTKAQLDTYTGYNATNIKADLDDVAYQQSLTHRVTVQVSGAYRGTGNTSTRDANTPDGSSSGRPAINILEPLNLVYDFIPATGSPVTEADAQRELVSTAACNDCHGIIGHGFHNGGRTDARYCAMCHTDQRKYGYADGTNNKQKNHAVGDFVMLGHTLHLGNRGFKSSLSPRTSHDYNYAGVEYKEIGYPMDIRNCVQCHKSDRQGAPAAQGDNWNKKPSRLACGACHDGIDWTASHHGGVRIDDSSCGTCHGENATRSPFNSHRPVDVTKQNPTTSDRYHNFTYDLKSATVSPDRNLVVQFRIKLDGEAMTTRESLAPEGFTAGPRFHFVYALPQDGIEKPADFNVYGNGHYATLANVLNGNAGALSAAPDADGYWTVTINGFPVYDSANANNGVTIPADASMLTCYIDGSWTQSDIGDATTDPTYTRYRVAASKNVLVGGVTGNVARREVVSAAKCNDCHEMLGTSYITRYYPAHAGGAANDPMLCGVCHYVNRSGNGWSGNISYITHAVHGIGKRTVQYARYRDNKATPFSLTGVGEAGYPGVTNSCEQCHLPGTYDFSSAATLNALPNMLWSTVAAGSITVGANTSPYVAAGNYGTAFSATAQATTATLVNSPITHACFGCHDSASAIAHMKQNGGAFFESRGSLNGDVQGAPLTKKTESCLVCHGSGRSADIKKAHGKF